MNSTNVPVPGTGVAIVVLFALLSTSHDYSFARSLAGRMRGLAGFDGSYYFGAKAADVSPPSHPILYCSSTSSTVS